MPAKTLLIPFTVALLALPVVSYPVYAQEMAQPTTEMQAVTLFATYAKGGDDPAVKEFAEKTLPKLEMRKMYVLKLVAAH